MRRFGQRLGAALAAGVAVTALVGCSQAGGGGSASPSAADSGIGAWPSFLPSPSAAGMASGSVDNPAMSYSGQPVVVQVADGSTVQVNVNGPSYPASTKLGADTVDCTFEVSFSDASAAIDLSGAVWDVQDNHGGVHRLTASGTPVTSVAPGSTAKLKLTAKLPSGEGLVRFYPAGGSRASAGWDYVAETD